MAGLMKELATELISLVVETTKLRSRMETIISLAKTLLNQGNPEVGIVLSKEDARVFVEWVNAADRLMTFGFNGLNVWNAATEHSFYVAKKIKRDFEALNVF